jgi:adenylate kinase family enzyme
MQRVAIFGNSGSGKTPLALRMSSEGSLAHLDLDSLAWQPTHPPTRRALQDSAAEIRSFMSRNHSWVIEGCYSDLLELVLPSCTQVIFLNPGVEACIRNCRSRPWEPTKYASPEEQDRNLEMLCEWVRAYETRTDEFSLQSHRRLFDSYLGSKEERTSAL